ncbi:MAG: hypothetical protein ACYTFZ_07935 [Planctomycetota bacterium]|jgi:hypothetical protein
MSLVFMDSFDHWADTQEERKWDAELVSTRSTTNPRTGPGCGLLKVTTAYYQKNLVPALGKIIVGFGIFLDDSLTSQTFDNILRFESTGAQLGLQYSQVDQRFRFQNLGTSANSSNSTNTYDMTLGYLHIEVKVTFDNATNSNNTVELRVNENVEISDTMETDPEGTDDVSIVQLSGMSHGAGGGVDVRFDDFYILDTNGSNNNDFIGDTAITALFANADGALTAWTGSASPDWQQVDDATPDDDTTYIESSTNGEQSTFSMDAVSGLSSIKGIQINVATRKTVAGNADIKILTRSGGTTYASSAQTVGVHPTIHNYLMQQRDVDPDTSVAWTAAGLDAAEFGVEAVV